ncbi:hypothetical protein O0L34_g10837 [Tuta absoluta]|nr:hypothetical protein O0L34_g10837 [Tuta absoluta]
MLSLKSKKNLLPFNKGLDIKLLKLIEEHRVLYDPTDPKHMDLDSRETVWKLIAEQMNIPASVCKTRWVNIRDMMRRRLRDRFRNPHQRTYMYRYEEQLAFVIPFFKESLTDQYASEDYADDTHMEDSAHIYLEDATYLDSDPELKPTLRQLTDSLTQDTETREATGSDEVQVSAVPQYQNVNPSQVNPLSHFPEASLNVSDPIDVFLMTVGNTLRKFSPYYLNQAKSKIFQVVQDYELQQICDGKDGNPGSSNSNTNANR